MIVVDSSVLVMYLSREPGWRRARELLLEPAVTLELALKEAANALWKKVRRGELGPEEAERLLALLAESLPLYPQRGLVAAAFRIAVEQGVTVYDALFIALAEELRAPLATADQRQARAAEERGVETILIPPGGE